MEQKKESNNEGRVETYKVSESASSTTKLTI